MAHDCYVTVVGPLLKQLFAIVLSCLAAIERPDLHWLANKSHTP